jgi:hypothetical protein
MTEASIAPAVADGDIDDFQESARPDLRGI